MTAYRKALELDPQNELALAALADAYRALGRPHAAVDGYRALLERQPRQPHVWYQRAALYLDLGRRSDAGRRLRPA